jgi:hypothetical protein
MGTIGQWIGVLLMAAIFGICLAAQVPRMRDSENANFSKLLGLGCALSALAMGMVISFGTNVLRIPLACIFIPAIGAGVLLYSRPLSRANPPSNLEWVIRSIVAILAIGLWLVLEKRGIRNRLALVTPPAIAGAMLFSWMEDRKTQRANEEHGAAADAVDRKLD